MTENKIEAILREHSQVILDRLYSYDNSLQVYVGASSGPSMPKIGGITEILWTKLRIDSAHGDIMISSESNDADLADFITAWCGGVLMGLNACLTKIKGDLFIHILIKKEEIPVYQIELLRTGQ